MQPSTFVHIAIPVRNEERRIEDTLAALSRQYDSRGQRISWDSYETIILANNCDDYSSHRAHRFRERNRGFRLRVINVKLPPERAHIGWARRLAMDRAAQRSCATSPGGIVATTDADSRVSPFWLAALREEFAQGAEAVCGRILLDPGESLSCDPFTLARHETDEEYRLLVARLEDLLDPVSYDPRPRHHQHFGANFAVRTATYLQVGGVPPVNGLEDIAFFEALVARDVHVRHTFAAQVTTSARMDGRAAIGLSAQLRDWSLQERLHLVESADFLRCLFQLRASLRKAWMSPRQSAGIPEVAMRTGLGVREIEDELAQRSFFGRAIRSLRLRECLAERWPAPIWQPPATEIVHLRLMVRPRHEPTVQRINPAGISPVFAHQYGGTQTV